MSSIFCFDFSNVQINEFMTMFEKKLDKLFNLHVNSLHVKVNLLKNQFVQIINAYAAINNRLNELTNKKNLQRLLIDQDFKQKVSFKRNDAINFRLFNNETQNENNNFVQNFRVDRRIIFNSNSFLIAFFTFFDLIDYFFRISSLKSLIAEQMNYFDFKKESKSNNIVIKISFFFDLMIIVKKHTYYKNVYVFVNRFKNQVKQHDHEQIKNVIYDCLRDDANY